MSQNPPPLGPFPPVFSWRSGVRNGRGRPVTPVAPVPRFRQFVLWLRAVGPTGRPVTAAGLVLPPAHPAPRAPAPGVCADAPARLPGHSLGLPPDALSPVWHDVEVGIPYCMSSAFSRPMPPAGTSACTRSSASALALRALLSCPYACIELDPPRTSLPSTTRWISSPPQSGSQFRRRQRMVERQGLCRRRSRVNGWPLLALRRSGARPVRCQN